jgi:CheY-like chemotaxis protein/predicted regulator of Ras-like GTPase activity (Roadblock/LC7/MglB family)
MSKTRRVLAVDEHRATLEFLDSVLPLVEGEAFEIRRALSAEEGLLELRRRPYDLLISGLRLPGMDGLALSARAKQLRPQMGVIVATARPLGEVRDQAAAAGVDRLLHKPLDAEEFLAAVQQALPDVPPATARAAIYASEETVALPSAVIRRLESLGDETGADQVMLASVAGEIVHVTGGQLHRDVPHLVALASASVSRALDLSEQLNDQEPKAVQFVEGTATDLYWANVGRDYFIAILFDAQLRRGRIGTVWVFAQRAVAELKRLLAASVPPAVTGPRPASARVGAKGEDLEPPPTVDPAAEAAASAPEETGTEDPQPPHVGDEGGADEGGAEEPARSKKEQALDAFWDEALVAEGNGGAFNAGISLAEAKARGLVAEDFDPDQLDDGG